MSSAPRQPSNQAGFSLIEILVSIILMSLAMLGLVPITLKVAASSSQSTQITQRAAALSGAVERMATLPFDALTVGTTTCTPVATSAFQHTNCVSVSSVNTDTKRVTVVVTPAGSTLAPDTTVIEVSNGSSGNPFNTQ